jgi:hypothetical protein
MGAILRQYSPVSPASGKRNFKIVMPDSEKSLKIKHLGKRRLFNKIGVAKNDRIEK